MYMDSRFSSRAIVAKKLREIALVTIGTFILAVGSAAFLIPFELVSGGITGVAIILAELTRGSFLGVELIVANLSWISFFIGLIFLGKSFALKTMLSSFLYPIFIGALLKLRLGEHLAFLSGSFYGIVTVAAIGGALVGIGCAVSFIGGGSTGGVDILALVIKQRSERFEVSRILLFIDSAIILIGALVISEITLTVLGILSAITSAISIEMVFKIWKAKQKTKYEH